MKQAILLAIMTISLIACEKSENNCTSNATREYPSLPEYSKPINNDRIYWYTQIIFKWNVCSDPQGDPVTYDLVVSGPEGHISQNLTSPLDSANFSYPGNYTWYVIARDNHGNFTQGPTWKFTIYG